MVPTPQGQLILTVSVGLFVNKGDVDIDHQMDLDCWRVLPSVSRAGSRVL